MEYDCPRWMLTTNCAFTLRNEEPATLANASTYDQLLLSIGEALIDKLNFIAKIPEYRKEIHEIAKKAINKTYDPDTSTGVILGELHLARKNLQDLYENKATIGGKTIIINPQFIVKRIDEVTRAITSIREKVDGIKSICDRCSNIEAQLPGTEDRFGWFGFDLSIGSESESRVVRVELYEEKSILDGMTCHLSRITYSLKDYPSLQGDIRLLCPNVIDDMKKKGASFIDLAEKGYTDQPLFSKLCRPVKLKDILDREQTVFKWQPDNTKDEDVK